MLKWVKLSNSGNTLKLLILSYTRKIISGWTKFPCMVITQKMIENEMGYRGSKSLLDISKVKEQRVDGSYFGSVSNPRLRCTLTGGESRYHIKIPSNQLNPAKLYNYARTFSTLPSLAFANKLRNEKSKCRARDKCFKSLVFSVDLQMQKVVFQLELGQMLN